MKFYIAGPITGHETDYREKFGAAAKMLERAGHTVLNPAVLPDGLEYAAYMRIGFAMLKACDAIYLLPGWKDSHGAVRELHRAVADHKKILDHEAIMQFAWDITPPVGHLEAEA